MSRRALSLLTLAGSLLALGGCDPFRPLRGISDVDAGYTTLLRAQSREVKVYDGLVTALIARGTWVDPTLAAAQQSQLDRMRLGGPGPTPVSPALALAVWSERPDAVTVGTDAAAAWRVRVLVDGAECPVTVTGQPATAEDRALFPYLTVWNQLWIVSLDPSCGDGRPELQLSGAWASATLSWAG